MNDDERKPRLHIHLGGLIILILIALILFKVDIKSKIDSPQFQKNYTYIETHIKTFWLDYIYNPLKAKTGDMFINFTNKKLEEVQKGFSENVLKTDGIDNDMNKYQVE